MFGDQKGPKPAFTYASRAMSFMGYPIPVPALSILPHLSIEVCVSPMHTLELVHDLSENS
jgi:hypothetical protein